MKNLNIKIKTLVVGIVLSTSIISSAGDADKAGNGGNAFAVEMSRLSENTLVALRQICNLNSKEYSCKHIDLFQRAVDRTTILVEDVVYGADGKERDATNDGDYLIKIGRFRWEKLGPEMKLSIAIHEHLSIMRIEDSDRYGESNEIVSTLSRYKWSADQLLIGNQGERRFTNIVVVYPNDFRLYSVYGDNTSALGYCVSLGFKSLVNYATDSYFVSNSLLRYNAIGQFSMVSGKTFLVSVTCGM